DRGRYYCRVSYSAGDSNVLSAQVDWSASVPCDTLVELCRLFRGDAPRLVLRNGYVVSVDAVDVFRDDGFGHNPLRAVVYSPRQEQANHRNCKTASLTPGR